MTEAVEIARLSRIRIVGLPSIFLLDGGAFHNAQFS